MSNSDAMRGWVERLMQLTGMGESRAKVHVATAATAVMVLAPGDFGAALDRVLRKVTDDVLIANEIAARHRGVK